MMDSLTLNEIQERTAKINTFERFGRVKQALNESYKLRLDIQASGLQAGKAADEIRTTLQDLEALIDVLEKRKFSGPGYFLQGLVRTFQLMMEGKEEEDRIDL